MCSLQDTTLWAVTPADRTLDMDHALFAGGQSSRRKRATCPTATHRARTTVTAVVVALCLTVLLPFLCLSGLTDTNDPIHQHDESDERVGRIVRSLSSIRAQEDRGRLHKRAATLTTVRRRFPWLEHQNALPNYFLRSRKRTPEVTDAVRKSSVVFVHMPTSSGDALDRCVERLSNGSHAGELGTYSTGNGASQHFRSGIHTFGSCRNGSTLCSYFSAFHEPFKAAVATYKHCQSVTALATSDSICAVMDANHVTLRQWLLRHGSVTFQHLVFNAHNNGSTSLNVSTWNRQKLALEQLSAADRVHLLDYVIGNLEKWFYVIALEDDIESSVKLLETAFKLPFSNCAGARRPHATVVLDNGTYRKKRNDHVSDYTESDGDPETDDDDNDPDYLVDDYSVRTALEADYKIYHRAKEIFKIQKQFVFNTI